MATESKDESYMIVMEKVKAFTWGLYYEFNIPRISLSGFTNHNNRNHAKWSHEACYQLHKSTLVFPIYL